MKWLALTTVALALQTGVSISVSPESGPPGVAFEVTGVGFVPREPLKVYWDGSRLPGTARADADGRFAFSGTVPEGAVAGSHLVRVVGRQSGEARTGFTVVVIEPSTTTTTSAQTGTRDPATSSTTTLATDPLSTPEAIATTVPEIIHGDDETDMTSSVTPSDDSERTEAAAAPARAGGDPPPARGSRLSMTGALLAALTVVGMVVGGLALLPRKRSQPDSESDTALDPDIADEPEPPSPPPDIEASESGWTRRALQLTPDGTIEDVTAYAQGFLAVGGSGTEALVGEATIWRSDDGIAWRSVVSLGPGRSALVLSRSGELLVLGTRQYDEHFAACCWSSRDGYTWERRTSRKDDSLVGVGFEGAVVTADAMIAYGRGPRGPGCWISRNGKQWEQGSLRGRIDLISPVSAGLVAFGRNTSEHRPIVAHSSDGRTWTEETSPRVLFDFDGIVMSSLIFFDEGFVAAGTDRAQGSATIWVSNEGQSWHRVPLEVGVNTSISHLARCGDHILAVGAEASRHSPEGHVGVAAWKSRDAVSWERVEARDLFVGAVAKSIVPEGETSIVYGNLAPGDGSPWPDRISVAWTTDPSRSLVGTGPAVAAAGERT